MFDKKGNDIKKDIYQSELEESLSVIRREEQNIRKLNYFIKITQKYFDESKISKVKPKFIILGTSIPEEIIYACSAQPFWVLGGSLGTYNWADGYVPRDADAVSQSILGFLLNDKFDITQKATVIIPITCDNMRKIAFLLERKGVDVITVDIPPNKYDETSKEKWISQMWRLAEKIQDKTKKRLTKDGLDKATNLVNSARDESIKFIEICKNLNIISGVTKMFVLNTYYYTDDIVEWTNNMRALNSEIENIQMYYDNYDMYERPKILLMGSPVLFPNYKIPFLLEEINFDIATCVDAVSQKVYTKTVNKDENISFQDYFEKVVMENYWSDCSAAYVDNVSMYEHVYNRLLEYPFDGVIYHVLKGQIEHDFELRKFEKLFASRRTPVFRLETDYNYHDVEQLKIRVEAFMEMLMQNRYRNEREI